jgi:hypothetical protein
MSWPDVTVVDACVRRDGRGGSPTAVTDDDPAATDADRGAESSCGGSVPPGLTGCPGSPVVLCSRGHPQREQRRLMLVRAAHTACSTSSP